LVVANGINDGREVRDEVIINLESDVRNSTQLNWRDVPIAEENVGTLQVEIQAILGLAGDSGSRT